MHSLAIVPNFDELEDGGSRCRPGLKLLEGTLSFQGGMKAFHGGIIITVTGTAHADLAVGSFQQAQVALTGVLTATVSVME